MSKEKNESRKEQNNQIIIYSTTDGEMKLEVKIENETVWLSQKQMAELFDKDVRTVSLHIQMCIMRLNLAKIKLSMITG